ncbi:hypothetical protein [Nitrobacter sp. TKz-YC02]|uniref:hypothetical protein n=1 Tax=Nitrobacter sp. TKz-YC02 TaxID=3398704 RepID=UPI003CF6234C
METEAGLLDCDLMRFRTGANFARKTLQLLQELQTGGTGRHGARDSTRPNGGQASVNLGKRF